MNKVVPVILGVLLVVSIAGNVFLYSELSQLQADLEEANSKISEYEQQIKSLQGQVDEYQTTISNLQRIVHLQEKKLSLIDRRFLNHQASLHIGHPT